jgi:hypothetical protein
MRAIAPLALLASACTVLTPQRDEDLPYRSGSILRHEGGALRRGLLVEPTEVLGFPCRGYVWLHPSGALDSFELARDAEVAGRTLPEGSRVFLREDGSLEWCWLSRDLVIDGIRCNGGWGKITTAFHSNGRLSAVFLSEDQEIQGVPCEASVFHPVELDEEGRLRGCQLSRAWRSHGREFAAREVLRFDADGRPELAR